MRATTYLEAMTGRSAAWWVAACQEAVRKSGRPSDDPNHDRADVPAFLAEVSRLVAGSLPPVGESYDPNMRAGATSALVLALWYGRLAYAKAHDPARPASLRQRAYARWAEWVAAMLSAAVDERDDAAYFPGQGWDYPFGVDAADGDFV